MLEIDCYFTTKYISNIFLVSVKVQHNVY